MTHRVRLLFFEFFFHAHSGVGHGCSYQYELLDLKMDKSQLLDQSLKKEEGGFMIFSKKNLILLTTQIDFTYYLPSSHLLQCMPTQCMPTLITMYGHIYLS